MSYTRAFVAAATLLAIPAAHSQTNGAPAGVGAGQLGAPAGVANPTPSSPFGTRPAFNGANASSAPGMPAGSTLPGSGAPNTGSSAGVTLPADTAVFSSNPPARTLVMPGTGVVSGNSPFPCVIGSSTNPC